MPYSLKQLKSQRDTYNKNIEELRASAEDKGAGSFGNFTLNPLHFFNNLSTVNLNQIDAFLSFFPTLPEILELQRKAAREEKKRRECEVKISKMMEEKRKKRKREFDEEQDTGKRMMLTGGTGEGTSQTMN